MELLETGSPDAINFAASAEAIGVGAEAEGDSQDPPCGGGENKDDYDGDKSNGFHGY
jgi:hypothetical protein